MLIPLKLVRDQQLQQQLFDQLRDLIVAHRLLPGLRMPSTRMMAEQFAISRVTVVLAYERLIAEGYLDTRPAAGTFVARPPAGPPASRDAVRETSLREPSPRETSPKTGTPEPDVRIGTPDPSLFPAGRWRSLMRSALDVMGARLGSEHPAGHPALRAAIAGWLSTSRGLAVSPDQVVLTRGRQQAFHLATHLIPHAGSSRTVVEDPCDPHTAAALLASGGELVRVPIDADGLRTDRLPARDVALIHVTPEHQRPLGVTLSRPRRTDLLAWSERAGALVLEDDCEGELRYGDMNVPSLMSLDTTGRVILMGGFGVSLGPWLDLTYLVSPRRMVPQIQTARRLIDDSRSGPEQIALADFVAGGGYGRHLHRLTKAYASRRNVLIGEIRRHFGEGARILGEHAGLHLAWFPPPRFISSGSIASLARRHGLDAAAAGDDAVLLGFGTPDELHIEAGVRRLAEALNAARERLPRVAASSHGFARTIVQGGKN
jgi:GntR family transcriptional regulator/MocR family aminotransferase